MITILRLEFHQHCFFKKFVISDVPILLSSDGSNIIFKAAFSEPWAVGSAQSSLACVFPIVFSMAINKDLPSLYFSLISLFVSIILSSI